MIELLFTELSQS